MENLCVSITVTLTRCECGTFTVRVGTVVGSVYYVKKRILLEEKLFKMSRKLLRFKRKGHYARV